jgi:hypothetical protein
MAAGKRVHYFLSDETVSGITGMIRDRGIDHVCTWLNTSPKSLRSWLCRGQTINRTHRMRIVEVFGDSAIVDGEPVRLRPHGD